MYPFEAQNVSCLVSLMLWSLSPTTNHPLNLISIRLDQALRST